MDARPSPPQIAPLMVSRSQQYRLGVKLPCTGARNARSAVAILSTIDHSPAKLANLVRSLAETGRRRIRPEEQPYATID